MRLNKKEVSAITESFNSLLPDLKYQIYLFGSRVDDSKKGGDIDLLVVVESLEQKAGVADLKTKIKMKIFETLDEQKIDITVVTNHELKTDPFLLATFPKALLLDGLPSKAQILG